MKTAAKTQPSDAAKQLHSFDVLRPTPFHLGGGYVEQGETVELTQRAAANAKAAGWIAPAGVTQTTNARNKKPTKPKGADTAPDTDEGVSS